MTVPEHGGAYLARGHQWDQSCRLPTSIRYLTLSARYVHNMQMSSKSQRAYLQRARMVVSESAQLLGKSLHTVPYRLTLEEWEVYKDKIQTLLSKRLIRKSSSPYAAPVIFVPQGFDDEGKPKIRMVIDYRALNKITVKDRFPLPHPEDLIAKLHGMKYFTKLDFWSRFHQHRCHPEKIEKTAFIGPDALRVASDAIRSGE